MILVVLANALGVGVAILTASTKQTKRETHHEY